MSNYVIVSGYHDYRSPRRADLHFIADELRERGPVFFLSIRFSELTRAQEDPRHGLRFRANRFEVQSGVECYLWRTTLHPVSLPRWLRPLERLFYTTYADTLPVEVRKRIESSTTILVESGIGILLLEPLRRLSPSAKIIYMASDGLTTINQSSTIRDGLIKAAHVLDSARLPSPHLRSDLPSDVDCYFIPHGIDKRQFSQTPGTPYTDGTLNAVSVGSMLFDRSFFDLAAPQFPNVTFYAIGSGLPAGRDGNVHYLPEMPFRDTLPYISHAEVVIAPYQSGAPQYLTHTSMKLTQYNYLGKPAVCPNHIVGRDMGRFGYEPGNAPSIRNAIEAALAAGKITPNKHLTWRDVTDRVLDPAAYPATFIDRASSNQLG